MAPVGVVRKGDVHKRRVAVVAEDRRRNDFAAGLLALHAGEVGRLYDRVYVRYLHSTTF